ncbi:beta-lactamase [Streptantibioticus cattleyicolor NRRL 8057 = DSM 46488]|uniref:Beta-lactamase n=1 Tax=Streptantibioticus cattleyicolor (strain ATCC 35852 / DSM 46488 / JCM 4925 / NBRC 14057 / NRRL 8057) TaxID=1003195 RepID=G8WMR3_STREN|nr:beta-lactamase [Streptantibioticus cattleyicolor NRRL 8057 = DSM 46488]
MAGDPVAGGLVALSATVPPEAAVVLATVRAGATRVDCKGRTGYGGGAPVDAETPFEIGSLTKTFTALLLAELAQRGVVHPHEPVDAFLPPGCRPRVAGGAPITLLHLATHTSGLPGLPPGLVREALPVWFSNPYARFEDADLLRAAGRTRVREVPGSRVRYSNFGVALLGRLLSGRVGTRYAELVAGQVCVPLGLTGTGCAAAPRGAVGHRYGRALPPWRMPGLPGAGALRSTGRDLARYLAAHLSAAGGAGPRGPLAGALRDVARPRLVRGPGGDRLALVWNVRETRAGTLCFHSGATRGFTAFIGFAPERGVAVAALTNTAPRYDGGFVQCAYGLLGSLAG